MYRDSAAPETRELHRWAVSTGRGHGVVVLLGVIGVLGLVAGGTAIAGGAPPSVLPWAWPMIGVGAVAIAGAFVRHARRRRQLAITRQGDRAWLVVPAESVELEFPLRVSGYQILQRVNGLPMFHVWLKLSDARGHGVVVREVRGAVHGEQPDWYERIDDPTRSAAFEAGSVHMLGELRAAILAVNDDLGHDLGHDLGGAGAQIAPE